MKSLKFVAREKPGWENCAAPPLQAGGTQCGMWITELLILLIMWITC